MKQKKPYVKPGIVFEDYETGELFGTPEMIRELKAKAEQQADQMAYASCPSESMSCSLRPVQKRVGYL